jgi:glutamine amidotransferase-like uncharacterized protein
VRIDLDPTQPLAFGMPAHTTAFFGSSSAFEPAASANALSAAPVTTVARYASNDVLVSGWLEGENMMASRAAVVQAIVGQGRVVLLGFPAQHRAQSHATYRLLFNALLTAGRPALTKTH